MIYETILIYIYNFSESEVKEMSYDDDRKHPCPNCGKPQEGTINKCTNCGKIYCGDCSYGCPNCGNMSTVQVTWNPTTKRWS